MVAKYWLESLAKVPCDVEIASEYRYRESVPDKDTLVLTISQSGETADTLAALEHAKSLGMDMTMTICNVATSAMVKRTRAHYITRAGVEIGVASTKAFTTQLAALFLMTSAIAKEKGLLSEEEEKARLKDMRHLPEAMRAILEKENEIKEWASVFAQKNNALFLGRGMHYPIALEGALKLKEISYLHAEGYPAGELKHGPLALVDAEMPVVTVAPNDELWRNSKATWKKFVHVRVSCSCSQTKGATSSRPRVCMLFSFRKITPFFLRFFMSFLSSCWLITQPSQKERMWINREIWLRA